MDSNFIIGLCIGAIVAGFFAIMAERGDKREQERKQFENNKTR